MKFIVTAGGQGTKLWPLSRENKPKQFQNILGTTSLFTYTINTLLKKYSPQDIFISTKKRYIGLVSDQASKVPLANYIIEPDIAKNRGPGEGLAFLTLSIKYPKEPFMIVQSDDLRSPEKNYLDMISGIERLVKKDRKLITGGIKATYPDMGTDYLKLSDRVKSDIPLDIYNVEEFVERTGDYYNTKRLIENFHVTTHCNHNTWYPDLMLNAYKKHKPDWYKSLMQIKEILLKNKSEDKIKKIYSTMEPGSTEEVTKHEFKNGYVVLVPYRWIDIGTWSSVYEYSTKNGDNYTDGNVITIETKGTLVKSSIKNKVIALMNVKDLIVVDTKDALLIAPKEKSGNIKDIFKKLKEQSLDKYL